MGQLDKLEQQLDETLNKKAPFKLPASSRKSLANAMWWLALIGGLLQLYLAWRLWDAWHYVNRAVDIINSYAASLGVDTHRAELGFSFYLALIGLLVSAGLLLLAAPGLKAMNKAGWNLVFYGLLINLAYGIVAMFTKYGDFGTFIGTLLGTLVGAFLLFQVRDHFTKSHKS